MINQPTEEARMTMRITDRQLRFIDLLTPGHEEVVEDFLRRQLTDLDWREASQLISSLVADRVSLTAPSGAARRIHADLLDAHGGHLCGSMIDYDRATGEALGSPRFGPGLSALADPDTISFAVRAANADPYDMAEIQYGLGEIGEDEYGWRVYTDQYLEQYGMPQDA